jgi:hypothetical protein
VEVSDYKTSAFVAMEGMVKVFDDGAFSAITDSADDAVLNFARDDV